MPDLPAGDLRQVRDEDDAELATLMERAYAGTVDEHLGGNDGAVEIAGWRPHGVPEASFAAVAGDRLVAASLISRHQDEFWLSYVITDPEWKGRGLGTAVVAASLRALNAPVRAGVTDGNTPSERLLATLGFTSELPVLVIDGASFTDFDGFAREFTKLLDGYPWRGNLDAFNDILRGGFGTPDGGWVFRWLDSASSRSALGHAAMATRLEGILHTCHPTNRDRVAAEIESARRGEGQTLFDLIVDIIRIHGPGGRESEDNVILDLR